MIKIVSKIPQPSQLIVDISLVSNSKIYAINCHHLIYKLQRIGEYYAFCLLSNSCVIAFGRQSDIRDAILATKDYDVYQFDNLREFLIWVENNR